MTFIFENADDGRHTSVHVPDESDCPDLIAARTIARYDGHWNLIDIERWREES